MKPKTTLPSEDYLIVGQGLAGSVLAALMHQRGLRITVSDQSLANTSSKVAAGIFNPITGRQPKKTWLADQLFPELHQCYPELEKMLGHRFFYPMPMYFPISGQESQNDWLLYASDPAYAPYTDRFCSPGLYPNLLQEPFGGVVAKQSGYLDVAQFLQAWQKYAIAEGIWSGKALAYPDLQIDESGVEWQGKRFKKVIFTEGYKGQNNPWFNWLDFRPVKGEILKGQLAKGSFSHIVNRGCWIIPFHDGSYKLGSNYDKVLDENPTEKGQKQILEKYHSLAKVNFLIDTHKAAIRPATYDRRPFLGLHPEVPSIGIFNGLGTKGVSLAPFFARQMIEYLEDERPLMPEVAIERAVGRKGKK